VPSEHASPAKSNTSKYISKKKLVIARARNSVAMALSSMSRTYLGSVAGRPGLGLRVPSVVGLASGSRTYAASAQKKAPAAKGTSKAGTAKRGATKSATAAPVAPSDRAKLMAAQQALMSEEDKLKEIERLLATNHLVPMVDPWGQQIEDTLGACAAFRLSTRCSFWFHKKDVMIPHTLQWSNPVKAFKLWKENTSNTFKNFAACVPEKYRSIVVLITTV